MNLKIFMAAAKNDSKIASHNILWLLIGLIICETGNTSQAAPIKPKAPINKTTKGKIAKTTAAASKPIIKAPLYPKAPLLQPTFTAPHDFLSKEGAMFRSLLVHENVMYGVCSYGGKNGSGSVWRVCLDGTDFKVLHDFTVMREADRNEDGASPSYMIWGNDGFLYGIATLSGQGSSGTIWRVGIEGNDFSLLHSFETMKRSNKPLEVDTNGDGEMLQSTLFAKGDDLLVGVCMQGGPEGHGTLWQIKRDGTGFKIIHSFGNLKNIAKDPERVVLANAEGSFPTSALPGSDGRLYGTTRLGGTAGSGVVFSCRDDGSDWRVLHTFEEQYVSSTNINRDGREAVSMIESEGWLYGISAEGGWDKSPVNYSENGGTIWRVRLDGSEFKVLHTFNSNQRSDLSRNGFMPFGTLFASKDKWIYGTTGRGGRGDSYEGNGTCFRVRPDGSDFQVVYGFDRLPYDSNIELDHPIELLPISNDGRLAGEVDFGQGTPTKSEKLFITEPLP